MKVAYLLNTHPLTSTTFIRREIEELEKSGVAVHRFAMRRWDEQLVDPRDCVEQSNTTYLLDNPIALAMSAIVEALNNPRRFWRAFRMWCRFVTPDLRDYRKVAYLFEAVRFKREARWRDLRHVHAHFASNATTVALLAHELGGPTFSFTAHGPEDFDEAYTLRLKLKMEQAAFVVAISEHARGQLAVHLGTQHWDKLHVVRCGLDLDEFSLRGASKGPGRNIVCIGRLTPRKGQVLLPRAAAEALRRHAWLSLTLIGDGETRDEIEREVERLDLRGRIRLLGWRSGPDIRAAIADSRALILPTLSEGLPVVILEALALCCPVVAPPVAGIPEVLDAECGWLVRTGDLESLSAAIISVATAEPDVLRAKGLVARRRVEEMHDIRKSATKLRLLFADYTEGEDQTA
ncbi:GDP-mannose-dependent alpha-(1-6)-phosphatidylinositol monomannoside mannosyltransferase [Jannaschia seosinensis]|uniref:GDP-mannose-dependent alpha-(1-6)-phosphatidylinositol monomannoside mannosyltransferase n=1 Tax=Jannaschia seosinensis TaxID=313367 RepID=A0A0M7BBY9_9RHOB|nr:glycosyltransferase family 4 protein [Jannaschia seosinensis]CUH39334.1 GDP-mannose-dependent alpha-(1-6)-phosphatidylinositol monomannoside mannosyltransferase [Jannaschia seosinensis]